ncbi:DUF4279 domain-containing protein [Rhodanobacter hydrolyticus]|uniref:DUF4279 domain-containing protein n=1 Tax=Rhodanobacter hydrolyticus TaxID=2250595 RepID=A0ABW8J250_9GAMM
MGVAMLTTHATMHTYTVQLRIRGTGLCPEEITSHLGLDPNQVRREGQPRGVGQTWSESMWSYDGSIDGGVMEWSSLEEGLLSVMNFLWSKRSMIEAYSRRFDVVWWCGHFQSSFDGGPTFSVALLGKLAEFGVPICLDNYFSAPCTIE